MLSFAKCIIAVLLVAQTASAFIPVTSGPTLNQEQGKIAGIGGIGGPKPMSSGGVGAFSIKGKDKKAVKLKKFKGFRRVLSAKVDNHATFERCIMPSIDNLLEGRTVCVFAYGHTGSVCTAYGYIASIATACDDRAKRIRLWATTSRRVRACIG